MTTNYNYLDAMVEDIRNYLAECNDWDIDDLLHFRSDVEEKLHDDLWTEDSVTGNASGSYTFNRWQAEVFVCDNMDLLNEMCQEFGIEAGTIGQKFLDEEWEWMDVSIRCYLLGQAISKALDEIEEELTEEEDTPQEMAEKLMEFNRDFSDSKEELETEIIYVAKLFEKLQSSDEFNALAHHLDIMFMDKVFDK